MTQMWGSGFSFQGEKSAIANDSVWSRSHVSMPWCRMIKSTSYELAPGVSKC